MVASRLPPLPPIRDLIRVYGLSASQKFSQNFILDKNVTDTIVRYAKISPMDDLVVEVGPGPGLLTRSILDAGARRVIAVEKDSRFMPALEQLSEAADHRLGIIQGDMLKLEHSQIMKSALALPASTSSPASSRSNLENPAAQGGSSQHSLDPNNAAIRLVGNLPFGVASPLLIQWLKMMALRQGIFQAQNKVSMTLMFQREVAEAIAAPPKHPERGRLSVMAQSICDVKLVYKVSGATFVPRPRVNAAVVHFEKKAEPLVPGSLDKLEDVVRFYFNKRRKTMGHNTNRMLKAVPELRDVIAEWQAMHFWDAGLRAQDVTTEQYCALARMLDEGRFNIPLT